MRVEFSDFRDSFAALPPARVSLDDARVPQFCIYDDPRLIAYYAPFDYLNTRATVVLVGVTPGPTQMLESYAIARDAMRAGWTDQDTLKSVKAHASFKGMRRDLGRWLDDLGLATVLGTMPAWATPPLTSEPVPRAILPGCEDPTHQPGPAPCPRSHAPRNASPDSPSHAGAGGDNARA